jgi:aminoglycoside phosphotransferase
MDVPPAIRSFIEGAQSDPVHIGKSAASVFRLRTHGGTLFLKTCSITDKDGLGTEADRLRWLAGRLSVPEVVSLAKDDGHEYLLVTSLPGVNGVEAGREHPERVAAGLAQALKMLHAQPIDGCPFDQTVATQIKRARQWVATGLVDETDFDDERLGRTAQELLIDVDAWRPTDEARSLTHGDRLATRDPRNACGASNPSGFTV